MTPPKPGVARAALAALALVTVACSSSSQGGGAAPHAHELSVKVRDFAIKAPEQLTAGNVVLRVRNAGPDTHELILVRADGQALPLRPDNLTVDEDALQARTIGILDDDHPGTQRVWELDLAPGRYVLFCNMSGHYLGGMYAHVVVR
ncbi:MAG: hypothetical protein QOH00_3389 [Gaiellales bacterium]|nr:hypothetical protein [Gaiellales bacterium]